MRELALILNRKRQRRGSIDFDLPEPLIEFDEFGEMNGVTRVPRNIAHRLIEEFMLSANEAVAHHLEQHRIASPLPHPREARSQARLGLRRDRRNVSAIRLGVGALPIQRVQMKADRRAALRHRQARAGTSRSPEVHITPRMYQKLTEKIDGKPEERILSYLMLRSLKQARYSRRERRPLRARSAHLHAFHLPHPPLPGPDRSSHPERSSARRQHRDGYPTQACCWLEWGFSRRPQSLVQTPRPCRSP